MTHRARITRLNWRGYGVAPLPDCKLLVPGVDIDELVELDLVHDHRDRPFGRLVRVLEPSPHRVDPECEQAHRCPGCPLRHLSRDRQRALKSEAHTAVLRRIAGVDLTPRLERGPGALGAPRPEWIDAAVPSSDYRAHANARPLGDVLGLYPHPGHDAPVDLSRCPAQTPEARALLARLALPQGVEFVAVQAHGDGVRVALHAGSARVVRGDRTLTLAVDEDLLDATWPSWTPQSPYSLAALRAAVVGWLDPRPTDHIVEVGCGVGTLSLPLARRAASLVGIDEVRAAPQDATRNAARAGVRATFRVGRAHRALRRLISTGTRADLVLVHAMRRPLGASVMSSIAALAPRRVLYVAPSVVSLARDLDASSLRTVRVGFLDQLPGTAHLLTLAELRPA